MNNKFFTYDDEKLDKLIFDLTKDPILWWSRIYEYNWALNIISSDLREKVIYDSCAGVMHPFKFALAQFDNNKVFASDLAPLDKISILSEISKYFSEEMEGKRSIIEHLEDKISWCQCDIANTTYDEKMFDYITCISVFEHLDKNKQKDALIEWFRVLKDDGRILLTCDYPWIIPEEIIEMAIEVGFEIDGKYNYNIPENPINIEYCGQNAKVFNMILKK